MNGAANFAFANRSALTHRLRETLAVEMDVETRLLYDVSHNIAKQEEHHIHGERCTCMVHRKGATRAMPGQPVLVPGDMGTGSWLLEGLPENRALHLHVTVQEECYHALKQRSKSMVRR